MRLLTLFSVLLMTTASWAGKDGNGGFGVKCGNSVQILDLYEAENVWGYTVDMGDGSYQDRVNVMLDRLARWMPVQAEEYREKARQFFPVYGQLLDNQVVIVSNKETLAEGKPVSRDIGNTIIPTNCDLVAMARNLEPEDSPTMQSRVFIFTKAWNAANNDSKAALILHELLYMKASEKNYYSIESSQSVRRLVALLASLEAENATYRELISPTGFYKQVSQMGLDVEYLGWVLYSGSYEFDFWDETGQPRYIRGSYKKSKMFDVHHEELNTSFRLKLRDSSFFTKDGKPQNGELRPLFNDAGFAKKLRFPLASQLGALQIDFPMPLTESCILGDIALTYDGRLLNFNLDPYSRAFGCKSSKMSWESIFSNRSFFISKASRSSNSGAIAIKGIQAPSCEILRGNCRIGNQRTDLVIKGEAESKKTPSLDVIVEYPEKGKSLSVASLWMPKKKNEKLIFHLSHLGDPIYEDMTASQAYHAKGRLKSYIYYKLSKRDRRFLSKAGRAHAFENHPFIASSGNIPNWRYTNRETGYFCRNILPFTVVHEGATLMTPMHVKLESGNVFKIKPGHQIGLTFNKDGIPVATGCQIQ